MSETNDTIQFVDYYQTPLNAGTYDVTAKLTAPAVLQEAELSADTTVTLHIAGPRYFLPPTEIHSVFPPENGSGDYNNILPHVVLNRRTLPWERLVDEKIDEKIDEKNSTARNTTLEEIPFLALLVFSEDEENNGDVTPPAVFSLKDLGYAPEPGEKPTDKINVIDVNPSLLKHIMPTGEELRLLTHGRERTQPNSSATSAESVVTHQRAVVIANRLPATPLPGEAPKRNIAHLVMLENRYQDNDNRSEFTFRFETSGPVRLVCLKSWQFTCSDDKPTLRGRLLGKAFSFDALCVPKNNNAFESLRRMSYAALPYHLRYGDRAHTLYHGPCVATPANHEAVNDEKDGVSRAPVVADSLMRVLEDHRIFDVSLAAAWQLGRMLMLRDQSVAMEYFTWRRRDAQRRATAAHWDNDQHLHAGDRFLPGVSALPTTVQAWCKDRLALRGIPFEYLVPDPRMLPENALRIFRIHPGWIDCLLSGALAVGRAGDADRILEAEYRSTVYPERDRERTGFLLRSPAVEEHPDLAVMALVNDKPLQEIRLERIGPGLLLGLYSGTFSTVQFSLPPIGLHFGLKETDDGFSKDLRGEDGTENNQKIDSIPMRTNNTNLGGGAVVDIKQLNVDISKLNKGMEDKLKTGMEDKLKTMTPGRFAFQMCEGTEMVEFGVGTL